MKSTFLCIEPINFNNEDQIQLFACDLDEKVLEDYIDKEPSWINFYKHKNPNAYQNTKSIKLNEIDSDLFKLPEHLPNIFEKATSYLILDTDLSTFTLCIEITLNYSKITKEDLKILLSDYREKKNLYDSIRNLLIKSEPDDIISPWTEMTHMDAIHKVKEVVKNAYYCEMFHTPYISINSGNITNFFDLSTNEVLELNEDEKQEFQTLCLNLNIAVDQFDFENPMPLYLNGEMFYFAGKFHTVFLLNSRNINRYYPIIFQMKYNWNFNSIIFNIYKEINLKIINEKLHTPFSTREKTIKNFMSKIQLFGLKNEDFENTIEQNRTIIYEKIEKKWNMKQAIEHSLNYIQKYEEYLDKEHKKILEKEKESTSKREEELLKKIELLNIERRKLEESNYKDELTRAYNRKKMYVDMKKYMEENEKPFHLSFIDGDKFKSINDTYGHQAGDEVLKKMVDLMFLVLRENNLKGGVYRYGGEEFLFIIYGERDIISLGALTMVKSAVEKAVIEYNDIEIKFTISLGATKSQKGQTIQEIIEIADQLVYKAKENGRNRIEYDY